MTVLKTSWYVSLKRIGNNIKNKDKNKMFSMTRIFLIK